MALIDIYRGILELSLFPKGTSGIAIIPEDKIDAKNDKHRDTIESFHIPDELFPSNCQIIRLPYAEGFVDSALRIFKENSSNSNIFVLPPLRFYRDLSDSIKKQYGNINLEDVILLELSKIIKRKGHLGVLMPSAFFISLSSQKVRKEVFDLTIPTYFVESGSLLHYLTGSISRHFQASMIILENSGDQSKPIRFFKLPEIDDDKIEEKIIDDFRQLRKQGGGETNFGYVLRDRSHIKDRWSYDLYHPDIARRKQDLLVYGAVQLLSDLVEIRIDLHINNNSERLIEASTDFPADSAPLIEGRDIRLDGSISFEDTRYRVLYAAERELLQEGDIVTRAILNPSATRKTPFAEITGGMLPLAASHSVLILRPKEILTKEDNEFLLAYLRSEAFNQFLSVETSGNLAHPFHIRKIPIPVPDENILRALQSINRASEKFNRWLEQAEQAKNSLFTYTSAIDSRMRILSTGRLQRQRSEAGSQVEDFRYRIRTQYPHPLAYLWRKVETGHPDLDGYLQLLEVAENAICYLACMGISATCDVEELEIPWVSQIAKKLTGSNQGTTMGDWLENLNQINKGKKYKNLPENVPFYEVFKLFSAEDFSAAVYELKDQRNHQAHQRGPKSRRQIEQSYQECRRNLEVIFQHCDFLTEYPLRYIEAVREDTIRDKIEYDYRDLVGDHPLVPLETSSAVGVRLEVGSLYLVDRNNTLHLLRPLLVRNECPACGRWATFYLDRYERKGGYVMMKSLEHGHTLEIDDEYHIEAFRYIGMLE